MALAARFRRILWQRERWLLGHLGMMRLPAPAAQPRRQSGRHPQAQVPYIALTEKGYTRSKHTRCGGIWAHDIFHRLNDDIAIITSPLIFCTCLK